MFIWEIGTFLFSQLFTMMPGTWLGAESAFFKNHFLPKKSFFQRLCVGVGPVPKSFSFPIYANFRTHVLKSLTHPHYAVLSVSNKPARKAWTIHWTELWWPQQCGSLKHERSPLGRSLASLIKGKACSQQIHSRVNITLWSKDTNWIVQTAICIIGIIMHICPALPLVTHIQSFTSPLPPAQPIINNGDSFHLLSCGLCIRHDPSLKVAWKTWLSCLCT